MTAKTKRKPQPVKSALAHRDIKFRFTCTECRADQTIETGSFRDAYQELEAVGWQYTDAGGWKCKKHTEESQ